MYIPDRHLFIAKSIISELRFSATGKSTEFNSTKHVKDLWSFSAEKISPIVCSQLNNTYM